MGSHFCQRKGKREGILNKGFQFQYRNRKEYDWIPQRNGIERAGTIIKFKPLWDVQIFTTAYITVKYM